MAALWLWLENKCKSWNAEQTKQAEQGIDSWSGFSSMPMLAMFAIPDSLVPQENIRALLFYCSWNLMNAPLPLSLGYPLTGSNTVLHTQQSCISYFTEGWYPIKHIFLLLFNRFLCNNMFLVIGYWLQCAGVGAGVWQCVCMCVCSLQLTLAESVFSLPFILLFLLIFHSHYDIYVLIFCLNFVLSQTENCMSYFFAQRARGLASDNISWSGNCSYESKREGDDKPSFPHTNQAKYWFRTLQYFCSN